MRAGPFGLLVVGGLLTLAAGCVSADRTVVGADPTVPDTIALSQDLPVFSPVAGAVAHVASSPPMPVVLPLVAGVPAHVPVPAAAPGVDGAAGETDPVADVVAPVLRRATFVFSGDTLTHSPLVRAANAAAGGNGFDFAPMFARIAPVISAADLGVCHLETPVAPPGTALSTYPQYGVPAEVVTGIASAGYDRCSTASNHTMDRGVAGIDATVNALEAAGLTQTGMARNPDEATAALVDVNGIAIAHLSFTMDLNGGRLPRDEPWRSNIISAESVIAAAADARHRGAAVVIVSLHWGTERVSAPNDFQRHIAEAVTASGQVDLIVGHHAHVIQPIESVNGRWVVFGMGNFLSNMPTGASWPASTQDGMMVSVEIAEQPDGSFVVERPTVVATWVDRDHGFVIRPVQDDLADPGLTPAIRQQLEASLARTSSVVGDFLIGSG